MSSAGGGGSATQPLAFRVMRLCRPSFHIESPLLVDPADLFVGEDIFDDPATASELQPLLQQSVAPDTLDYRSRLLLRHPTDALGVSGLLLLPQSFGAIYLGETFSSYISVNNSSNNEVRNVSIKAEIHSDRQRIVLLDMAKSPVDTIRAGGRYDFILEHDIKELGSHTLVCSAYYSIGDNERTHLQQYFKFVVSNPLSVRTKVRVVKGVTYLEACLENHTKTNLYMDQIDFEAAPNWSAKLVRLEELQSDSNPLFRDLFKKPVIVKHGGGVYNFLYELKWSSQDAQQSNALGKLQITWRTNLGGPGRLQTQQILGTPIVQKDIDLRVVDVPSAVKVNDPFRIHLNFSNLSERRLGPFEISLSEADSDTNVMINGLQKLVLPELDAFKSSDCFVNLIVTRLGVQRIKGLCLFEKTDKKKYELFPEIEIFVDLD